MSPDYKHAGNLLCMYIIYMLDNSTSQIYIACKDGLSAGCDSLKVITVGQSFVRWPAISIHIACCIFHKLIETKKI